MTQEELDILYEKIDNKCEENDFDVTTFDAWHEELEKLNADTVFCEGNPDDYEDFVDVLQKHGFTVLDDPGVEGMDGFGYVIFPPKK